MNETTADSEKSQRKPGEQPNPAKVDAERRKRHGKTFQKTGTEKNG